MPLDLQKYQPDENGKWACLGNPEVVLSFSQINDDICDCPDGSDEPGTAACPGTFFYCRNEGHIPGKLPSSRVNDGICDYDICCDGSDEAGLSDSGLTPKCENRCAKMHKEYIAKKEAKQALLKAASENRQKLIKKAQVLRENLKKEIATKEKKVEDLKLQLSQKEAELEIVEAQEAERIAANTVPKPKVIDDAQESLEFLLDEYKKFEAEIASLSGQLSQLSSVLEQMKGDYNPNFNDPAVKHAIRSFEEFKGNNPETSQAHIVNAEKLGAVSNIIESLKSYTPPAPQQSNQHSFKPSFDLPLFRFSDLVKKVRNLLVEFSIIPDNGESSSMVQPESVPTDTNVSTELTKQRNIVSNTKTSLSETERQLQEARKSLETEHGPDDILRALKDTCVSSNLGEYIYEICFYGKASQKSTKDNSSVNLGNFENVSIDDKSEDGALILYFEKGAKCWSGPIRRATVSLTCGKETALLQVTEPERCEYFIFGTSPAACAQYNPQAVDSASKDEL